VTKQNSDLSACVVGSKCCDVLHNFVVIESGTYVRMKSIKMSRIFRNLLLYFMARIYANPVNCLDCQKL
jgi:hypothetical protein